MFKGDFPNKNVIEFLDRLIKDEALKGDLIADGHPVHRGRKSTIWLESRKSQIELLILLDCFSNLNPDEMLNQDM